MLDLSRFEFRVRVARDSGQCQDYAQDVSELLAEIKRLRKMPEQRQQRRATCTYRP